MGTGSNPCFPQLDGGILQALPLKPGLGQHDSQNRERDKLLTNIICKRIIQPALFLGYTADNFAMQKEKKDQNQPTCQGT